MTEPRKPRNPFARAIDWEAECRRLLLSKKELQKRLELSIALNDAQARLAKVLPITEKEYQNLWYRQFESLPSKPNSGFGGLKPYLEVSLAVARSIGLIYEPSPEQAEVIPDEPAGQDEADLSSPNAPETGKTSSINMYSPYLGQPTDLIIEHQAFQDVDGSVIDPAKIEYPHFP